MAPISSHPAPQSTEINHGICTCIHGEGSCSSDIRWGCIFPGRSSAPSVLYSRSDPAMPSPSTTKLPIPKSWDEFEDIVSDVLRVRWATPHVTRNGRSGQKQHGVDIYAIASHLGQRYAGAQCKHVDALSE